MSNTIKVLINSDGITGREQNPFGERAKNTTGTIGELLERFEAFETNVKSYTVIGSCKVGDVVECVVGWQLSQKDTRKWRDAELPDYTTYNNFREYTGWKEERGYETRQVYLIVEAKESKPNEIADKIKEILKGIDKDEWEDNDGWWETSAGAEFGAKKLKEIIDFVLSLNIKIT